MSLPRPPILVFDLDGTLVDSAEDITRAFLQGFDQLGHPPPSAAEVRAEIGKPLAEMYARFAPASAVPDLIACYRAYYPEHCAERSSLYPGVREVLSTLRTRGYLLAVATTKQSWMARRLAGALGLTALVDHVQGTDDFPHKPDPEVICRALAALAGEGAWMVGDTVTDVEAGRAAGLRTYAVSWGTHGAERLREAGPDVCAPDLWGLLELTAPIEG